MEEMTSSKEAAASGVPLCKRPGCTKAAWPGRAYCSREHAPQGHLFFGQQDRAEAAKYEVVERQCAQHCGKSFRVMASSRQTYCSSLCQSLAEGTDPFKGPDWHGKPAHREAPKAPEEQSEMPKKFVETAAELARELGLEGYQIYHAIKTGRIKKHRDGFDVAEARLEMGGKAPRKAREPAAKGSAAAAPTENVTPNVTPIRPPLAAVPPASPGPPMVASLAEIRRKAFDAALAKFRAVLLEESDRLEATGDLRTQNQLLKDCIRAETRFQRCFDPEAA